MLARVAAVVGASAVVFSFAMTPASAGTTSISGYSPSSSGPVGSSLHIEGTGLAGVTDVVFAGGFDAHPVVAPTDGDVQVVVPQGAKSGVVSVTDGPTTTPAPSSFTVLPTASLTSSAASVVFPATAVLTAKEFTATASSRSSLTRFARR